MKLSIIIPCYNEVGTINTIIDAVIASPYSDKEIIVVDDGSSDGTKAILKNKIAITRKVSRIIYHTNSQGKDTALRSGIHVAKGEVVIIRDADLKYEPNEYSRLVEPILNKKADVSCASRFLSADAHRVLYLYPSIGNYFLTFLSNMLTNLNLTDMKTYYKVFRKKIIQWIAIEENSFGFEPKITAKIAKMHCRINEVGISYYGRTYDEGKKIGWKDGLRAIYCILKYNLR